MYIWQYGLSQRIFGMAEKHNLTLENESVGMDTKHIIMSNGTAIDHRQDY